MRKRSTRQKSDLAITLGRQCNRLQDRQREKRRRNGVGDFRANRACGIRRNENSKSAREEASTKLAIIVLFEPGVSKFGKFAGRNYTKAKREEVHSDKQNGAVMIDHIQRVEGGEK